MPGLLHIVVLTVLMVVGLPGAEKQAKPDETTLSKEFSLYAGSKTCIECHGKFYQLWSTSRHGLAMQPYTPGFGGASASHQLATFKEK